LDKPLFQIEGDDFDLIPLLEHHLPTTMAWRNSDSVRIWFKTPDVVSLEQHRRWYAAYSGRLDDFVFLIRDRLSGALAGQIAIYRVDPIRGDAEMGRLMVAPGYEGKGLMKKACACLINYSMTAMGINRIHLEVLVSNERAIRLYQKLGFQAARCNESLLVMALERKED
jgi:UDP-4-amino-4,6-dideoxy-N-acetyl-beta-L-altrosamine N-acetyltransferase